MVTIVNYMSLVGGHCPTFRIRNLQFKKNVSIFLFEISTIHIQISPHFQGQLYLVKPQSPKSIKLKIAQSKCITKCYWYILDSIDLLYIQNMDVPRLSFLLDQYYQLMKQSPKIDFLHLVSAEKKYAYFSAYFSKFILGIFKNLLLL